MAITKLATGEKRIAMFQQLRCSSTWARGIHEDLIYLSVFNIFLSIAAVLGNTLILMALRKVFSLHLPSKLLFRCLVSTLVLLQSLSMLCIVFSVCGSRRMASLSLHTFLVSYYRLHFVLSIFVDGDRNKHGQTSRSVVRPETLKT